MRSKGSHGVFAPTPFPSPAAGEGPSRQIAARSTRRLGIITFCYRFAVTPHKMRRRPLESVSSRGLSVRGSWGTAPSVFWFLLYTQKERPGGEPHRLCTLQNQRDADRRLQTWPPPGRRTGRHPPVTPRRRQATTNLIKIGLLPTFLHRKADPRRIGAHHLSNDI